MSLHIPRALILVFGVFFVAIGVSKNNGTGKVDWEKIFFNVTGSFLICLWADLAGLES